MPLPSDRKVTTYAEIDAWTPKPAGAVLCAGCFDALHVGHLEHLAFCRRHGNFVVACVGSDATVRALKGAGRPIVDERSRARMVAALGDVDAVVVSEENGRLNFTRLMELLRPSVLVVAAGDVATADKQALCRRLGVRLVIDDTRPAAGPSTTGIVTRVLETAWTATR